MMKQVGRQILVAEGAPVIQNALYMLLAGVESKRGVSPGTRERLEAIAEEGRDSLILDLQVVEQPLAGTSPRVTNVRLDHFGKVAVVTCEVANHQMVHQIDELCRPHFFPKHLIFSLGVFAHALFSLF
ncbi:MAG TPA: hypothetical protein VMV34_00535 [Terriglobia bacterium]|nr:hypothetical protein [Terriglobia bacterium]